MLSVSSSSSIPKTSAHLIEVESLQKRLTMGTLTGRPEVSIEWLGKYLQDVREEQKL